MCGRPFFQFATYYSTADWHSTIRHLMDGEEFPGRLIFSAIISEFKSNT